MPRVTRDNARQHPQNALVSFVKVTGESIDAIFTWDLSGLIHELLNESLKIK